MCSQQSIKGPLQLYSSPGRDAPTTQEESEAQGKEVTSPMFPAWASTEPKPDTFSLLELPLEGKLESILQSQPLEARYTDALSLWEAWYRLGGMDWESC